MKVLSNIYYAFNAQNVKKAKKYTFNTKTFIYFALVRG